MVTIIVYIEITVKSVLSGHSKIDKTKTIMTNGSLMKVKSIAECSPWSILQYFWPALSHNRSWKPIFGLLFVWPLKTGFTAVTFFSLSCVNKAFYSVFIDHRWSWQCSAFWREGRLRWLSTATSSRAHTAAVSLWKRTTTGCIRSRGCPQWRTSASIQTWCRRNAATKGPASRGDCHPCQLQTDTGWEEVRAT